MRATKEASRFGRIDSMQRRTTRKRSKPPTGAAAPMERPTAPGKPRREFLQAVEVFERIEEESRRRRSEFDRFVKEHRRLPSVQRAEAWLRFVAGDPEGYGDQEALVYLTNRGEDCSTLIRRVSERWQRAEDVAIRECATGQGVSFPGKRVTYLGGRSLTAAQEVEHVSPYNLRDFWHAHREQEQTIQATMLRTVETCGVGGFEKWWRRMARETTTAFVEGGLDRGPLVYWLFAMCRSELAIKLMPKAMHLALENIEIVRRGLHPWTEAIPVARVPRKTYDYKYADIDDLNHASTLVFANHRLRDVSTMNRSLLDEATGLLQRCQRADGSWPLWLNREKGAVESTATAIHALAYHQPSGWQRHAKLAAQWLEAQQAQGGYWLEPSSPDPTYLTVLVLDALELARKGEPVTFGRSRTSDLSKSNASPTFFVALSFPGEARGVVQKVAASLSRKLDKSRVFYDKNFEAILARPNLDLFLQDIYLHQSELVVVFLSSDYQRKQWCCNVEWPAIRDVLKKRRGLGDIMYMRLDDAEVEGVLSIDGHIDVENRAPVQIAKLILERLEHNRRQRNSR
jgi:hypothetical protein